jgi:hypothetical protein
MNYALAWCHQTTHTLVRAASIDKAASNSDDRISHHCATVTKEFLSAGFSLMRNAPKTPNAIDLSFMIEDGFPFLHIK